jgi:hypothetical protein
LTYIKRENLGVLTLQKLKVRDYDRTKTLILWEE